MKANMAQFSIATLPPLTLSQLVTFSSPPMEASPLTRQPQPEVFTPKIIQLYDSLFKVSNLYPCPALYCHHELNWLPLLGRYSQTSNYAPAPRLIRPCS